MSEHRSVHHLQKTSSHTSTHDKGTSHVHSSGAAADRVHGGSKAPAASHDENVHVSHESEEEGASGSPAFLRALFGGDDSDDGVAVAQGVGGDHKAGPRDDFDPTDLGQTAQGLHDHLGDLDSADGGDRDGKFGIGDLEAVANDASADPHLRAAARELLADPNALNALDVTGGEERDGTFSDQDLLPAIQEERSNPNGYSLERAADVLSDHDTFELFDGAAGETDGRISRDDLTAVLNDGTAKEDVRDLARDLLANDNRFNALDVASGSDRDGVIGQDDIDNINYSPTPESGAQWSGLDDRALQGSLKGTRSFSDLFAGVSQTDRGNCVSTAVIKASMDAFGNQVFDSVERTRDGGYNVTLRDGHEVSLSRDEMEQAATGAHFDGDDPETQAYATLCFGVMAKRAQEEGHDGARTYGEALLALNNGENPDDVPQFLGVQDYRHDVDVSDIPGHSAVVAWGNGHALYNDTLGGRTYIDAWGDQRAFDGTNQTGAEEDDLEHAFYIG